LAGAIEPTVRRGSFLLGTGAFLLYSLLPSRNWNYADDSLGWAHGLLDKQGLINEHHLYLNGIRFAFQALGRLGIRPDPAHLLAGYCAFFGALGLVVLERLLRRAGFKSAALGGACLWLFSGLVELRHRR
jgi:hypothetical protein